MPIIEFVIKKADLFITKFMGELVYNPLGREQNWQEGVSLKKFCPKLKNNAECYNDIYIKLPKWKNLKYNTKGDECYE